MIQEEAEELVCDYEDALIKSIAKTFTPEERFASAIRATTLKLHIIDNLTKNENDKNRSRNISFSLRKGKR